MQLNTCEHFFIQYLHYMRPFQSSRMSRNCTYLDIHDHQVSNGAWLTGALLSHENTHCQNSTILMASSEQVLPHYLLKSPTNNARALYLSMTT